MFAEIRVWAGAVKTVAASRVWCHQGSGCSVQTLGVAISVWVVALDTSRRKTPRSNTKKGNTAIDMKT
eukprot:1169407-Rhodomonas_salina.1